MLRRVFSCGSIPASEHKKARLEGRALNPVGVGTRLAFDVTRPRFQDRLTCSAHMLRAMNLARMGFSTNSARKAAVKAMPEAR